MNIASDDSYVYSSEESEVPEETNEPINESTEEDEGEWIELKDHPDYEIFNREPFPIRKKGSDNPIADTFDKSSGYYRCTLNRKLYRKHILIAKQFISNTNPEKFKFVDHINHVKTDNRLKNLRWCTHVQNSNNRSNQQFLQTIDKKVAIEVKNFNSWQFEDLYFINDSFVRYNGINYSVLCKWYDQKKDVYRTNIHDITGKRRTIYFNKFKHEYNLI